MKVHKNSTLYKLTKFDKRELILGVGRKKGGNFIFYGANQFLAMAAMP